MSRRKRPFNVYRDGKIHVCAKMCKTCIYQPDSPLMDAAIKREAIENDTAVICHSTLNKKDQLVCRGFYDNDRTPVLRLATAMGCVAMAAPPE